MPLSGGYYYPGIHNPVSSYPSLDLRGLGAAPATVGGLGRIYVMSGSGDLFYKDPSGNEIFLGSEISSSAGYVTGSTNFFVTNALVVSGSIVNGVGHLVLSSSAGSFVVVSGSLKASGSSHTITGSLNLFDGIDERSVGPYHLRSVSDKLILSSSAGSAVYISGNFQASGSHTFTGSVNLFDTLDARGAGQYHFRSVSNHLILSSSAGSFVVVSGNLSIPSAAGAFTGSVKLDTGTGVLTSLIASGTFSGSLSGSVDIFGGKLSDINASGTFSGSLSGSLNVNGGIINNSLGHLILSSSVGSVVAVSGALDLNQTNQAYHLRSVNNSLILSSSFNSAVYISGNLQASGSGHAITGSLGLFDGIDERSVGSYHLRSVNSFLILSSSAGSYVYISGSLFASGSKHTITGSVSISDNLSASAINFPVDAVSTLSHIRASNSHLILSSSAGSIIAHSGALGSQRLTTATLPVAVDILTGSIVWDDTRKTLKIYGPEGWTPIITGSAG
ncbi:MAG: hypothetical protein Q8Q92_03440 [bacterium]|nr:hypothetical protein [bacterium]